MSYDSLDYLNIPFGHFLNSMEDHVERLEKDYELLSERWLGWNTTYINSVPTEISPAHYDELRSIFFTMGLKLKGLETTLKTTFSLLTKVKITDASYDKKIAVKTAMLKRATITQDSNEFGWSYGRTLCTNVKGLLDLLKLHLQELRSVYTSYMDGGYSNYRLLVTMNSKFNMHYQAMRELILNFLSSLPSKVEEVIANFESDI